MVGQCQAVRPIAELAEKQSLTEKQSLEMTRNLLRIAIFNISYIRGLFPEDYFQDKLVPAIEMKIKKLLPIDVESRRLIDWMEKGVYEALQKKYLKQLQFGFCNGEDGPLVEQYEFTFTYPTTEAVQMTVGRSTGGRKSAKAKTFTAESSKSSDTVKKSICRMVRTLVELMRTLQDIPEERTILMTLLYYEDTPEDYEPPFFRACTEQDKVSWLKPPVKMKVGDVSSKHHTVALKVKSTLDSCEDENRDEPEDSEATIDPTRERNEDGAVCQLAKMQLDDDCRSKCQTSEAENLENVKRWILSRASNRIEMCDLMSEFPDIPTNQLEGIVNGLIEQQTLQCIRKDLYEVIRNKEAVNTASTKRRHDDHQTEASTMGLFHTTGSDVTRHGVTATESASVAASSAAARTSQSALSRESTIHRDVVAVTCSMNIDQSSAKTSIVQKPIYQSFKRLRAN